LIPGHEIVGTIAKIGKDVKGFEVGDRVVADPGITCQKCFFCKRGNDMMCENFHGLGVTCDGGFAEYFPVQGQKVYKIHNLTDEAATLVEPTACAVHGVDKLKLRMGSEVLIFGCGPTGLMMAQLLKLNGAERLVVAAPPGPKLDLAKKLGIADEYVELDRANAQSVYAKLKQDNPYGFDAVIEATGNEGVVNESLNHVRKGGKLLVYGVYNDKDLVKWPPVKIFREEIEIMGSFAQSFCFPRAVAYLDSGKIKTEGIVTHVFGIDQYQEALDAMTSRKSIKIAITPSLSK